MLALVKRNSLHLGAADRATLKFEPAVEQHDTLRFEPVVEHRDTLRLECLPLVAAATPSICPRSEPQRQQNSVPRHDDSSHSLIEGAITLVLLHGLVVLLFLALSSGFLVVVTILGPGDSIMDVLDPDPLLSPAHNDVDAEYGIATKPPQADVMGLSAAGAISPHAQPSVVVAGGTGSNATTVQPAIPMLGMREHDLERDAMYDAGPAEHPQMHTGIAIPLDPPEHVVRGLVSASIGANIRRGPGHAYAIIGGLSDGTPVTISNHMNDWFECVSASGEHGWIAAELIEIQSGIVAELPSRAVLLPTP